MSLAKKMVIILVGSALLLGLVVYLIGAGATAKAAWNAGLPAFLSVGTFLFALMVCQAAAWTILERKTTPRPPYRILLAATIVAMAGNVLMPSAHLGGEPVKIVYARRKTGIPYVKLSGIVLLCKYIEAMSFVLFLVYATGISLREYSRVLFYRYPTLGGGILMLTAGALVLTAVLWMSLACQWAPLTRIVGTLSRLHLWPKRFGHILYGLKGMEEHAFFFYLLTHVAMFGRPALFFYLSAHVSLNAGQLGLLFLICQGLLTVQFMPSAIGTLDGGLLLWASMPGLGISAPQCMAFLLCIRFWDAVVVALGALLAAGTGVAFLQTLGKKGKDAPEARDA